MPLIGRMMSNVCIVAAATFLFLAEGCSGPPPQDLSKIAHIKGTVAYKGSPVRGARLTFRSKKAVEPAFGLSDAQGRYTGQTNDTSGVFPGEYVITVTHPRGGIPAKYGDAGSSLLKLTLGDGEERDYPITLED